jgi:hypothetical protein
MILILTEPGDVHADRVEQRLRERGLQMIRIDPEDFPVRMGLSVSFSAEGEPRIVLRTDSATFDMAEIAAVWYRRPNPPMPHPELEDDLVRRFVEEECLLFVRDVLSLLDCPWVPAERSVLQRAHLKALQLKVAGTLGFELPPTLITNRPEDFLDFYREHGGNIVSKLAETAFGKTFSATCWRYTEPVSTRDVGYSRAIRYCPTIFQAYVPKRLELRITVVGREAFAAEIHSQQVNHTRHDWRRYDFHETLYRVHELPPDIRRCCVRLVEELGLSYGTIDMVLTPDERYVFLEINPNGQYLWIEDETGLPISDSICDLLSRPHTGMSTAQLSTSLTGGAW